MGLAEVDEVILLEWNLKNLSLQIKMFLTELQLKSSGPAKPRSIFSFTSDKAGKDFTFVYGLEVSFFSVFLQFEQFLSWY